MRILVEVSCWNEAEVIGATLNAILRQTLPVQEILVVDNASTDGTPDLIYPDIVTMVRNPLDLGISGGVTTGLEYARAHGYDWLWILDGDSRPRADALEMLVRMLEAIDPEERRLVGVLGSSHNLLNLGRVLRGRLLTPGGPRVPRLRQDRNYLECDSVIWCGALINLSVFDRVGLPRAGKCGFWEDMSMDYGDTEYTYRIHRAGYKILVHRDSIIDHSIGNALHRRFLGCNLYATNYSASRRYLYFRNLVFFWLKLYHRRNWPMLLVWFGYRLGVILAMILFLESGRGPKLKACLAGIRDGLRGRLDGNFEASP